MHLLYNQEESKEHLIPSNEQETLKKNGPNSAHNPPHQTPSSQARVEAKTSEVCW